MSLQCTKQIFYPLTGIDDLFSRAWQLGKHALLEYPRQNSRVKKPIRWARIDQEAFAHNISNGNLDVDLTDVNELANNVAKVLYECQSHAAVHYLTRGANRCDRLLHDLDDTRVWKAIDWQGESQDCTTANAAHADD